MRPAVRTTCWALGALVAAVAHNRLWGTPNLAFFTSIADHPGTNPFPAGVDGDYLLTSQTMPQLASALGSTAAHEYVRLHLVVLVVGLAAATVAVHRRFGPTPAAVLVVLVALSPAMTTTMSWLGQPDALTLPLALLAVALAPRWAVVVCAVLLGTTHPEQAVFIAVNAALARAAVGRPATTRAAVRDAAVQLPILLGGVLAGRAITEIYLRVNDVSIGRPRTAFLDLGLDGFVDHHLDSGPWLLIGLWGTLWLVIGAVAVTRGRNGPDVAWGLLGAGAVGSVVPMLLTLDETRVYALVTAPLVVAAAVLLDAERPNIGRVELVGAPVGVAMLVAGFLPAFFTAGDVYWSTELPIDEFVEFLGDGEHPGELTDWLLDPFGFEIPEPAAG